MLIILRDQNLPFVPGVSSVRSFILYRKLTALAKTLLSAKILTGWLYNENVGHLLQGNQAAIASNFSLFAGSGLK
jgi:hypothetical protein